MSPRNEDAPAGAATRTGALLHTEDLRDETIPDQARGMNPPRRSSRFELGQALLKSKLRPAERLMMFVLLERMDWQKRVIPRDKTPSLTELEADTQHCRTTVRNALYELEEAGWITRTPPPEELGRREHARTLYELHVPGSDAMRHARGQHTGPDHRQRRQAMAERLRKAREAKEAAAALEHGPAEIDWTQRAELVAIASRELAKACGAPVPAEIAREAVRLVLEGRTPDDPAKYLISSIRKEPRRFLPAPEHPPLPPKKEPADTAVSRAARKQLREIVGRGKPLPA